MSAPGELPTIVLVPGLWEGPRVYAGVSQALTERGYATSTVTLPSWGTKSPGNPTMADDTAAIREAVERLVTGGKTVALVLHSAAGFLGSAALQGLSVKARREAGEQGGVAKIVFITAGIVPEGFEHHTPPFAYLEGPVMHCKDYENGFFNDLDPEETKQWMAELKSHPAEGWDGKIDYCGWREIPSVYGLCTRDQILPPPFQRQMAEAAGSEIVEVDAGHVAMIKKQAEIVDLIDRAAKSV